MYVAVVRANAARGNLALASSALDEMCSRATSLPPAAQGAFSALLLAYTDRDMVKEVRVCDLCVCHIVLVICLRSGFGHFCAFEMLFSIHMWCVCLPLLLRLHMHLTNGLSIQSTYVCVLLTALHLCCFSLCVSVGGRAV